MRALGTIDKMQTSFINPVQYFLQLGEERIAMNAFRATFTDRQTFLPVIHVESRHQTLRNVDIAQMCDADGVFLISHGSVDHDGLIELYHAARERYPDFWIGLNLLGAGNREALSYIPENQCGLWSDFAGVTDTSEAEAEDFKQFRAQTLWSGIYFGGVAFNTIRDGEHKHLNCIIDYA